MLFGFLLLCDTSSYKSLPNKSSLEVVPGIRAGAGKYSHPISTINLSFPENRVVSPVCPAPAPNAWLVGMERKAWLPLSNGTFQGSGSSTFTTHSGVLCLVPAATLEVLLLHNSHELWNVSGHLQSDTLCKWHCQASRPRMKLACFSVGHSPAQTRTKLPGVYSIFLTLRLWGEQNAQKRKYRKILKHTPVASQTFSNTLNCLTILFADKAF